MTEKNMRKLTDMILDGIRELQKELDEQFAEDIKNLKSEDYTVTDIDPATDEILGQASKYMLDQLQTKLKKALSEENYSLAASLQKKIEDLKND